MYMMCNDHGKAPFMANPLALRDQIAAHIVRQITTGAWRVGDLVPSEAALMASFGTSRMTVHHALRELTARGLLRRHRGRGSFVAEPRPYVSLYDHQDIIAEIEARGSRHSARVIRQVLRPANPEEAADFGLEAGASLFHAVIIHRADGVPFELEDRLLNPAILPGCMDLDLEKRSLFSLLLHSRPYREGSETVRALVPEGEDRILLELTGAEPCLELVRRTWSPEGVVTRARLLRAGPGAMMLGRIATAPLPGGISGNGEQEP
jgi:GntR family transcriptional regulator, histidine utilization repressor